MQSSAVRGEVSLSLIGNFGTGPHQGRCSEHLLALGVRADGPPALTDYTSLLQACLDALAPVLDGLHSQGYAMWLFLAGAGMTPSQRASYPNHSLFSPAGKLGVEKGRFAEHDFEWNGKIRMAGLYQVRADQYVNACEFMARGSWSFAVLSRRPALATQDSFGAIYRASALDRNGDEMRSLDWLAASLLLAPMGDVVLRPLGWADDKYRSLVLTCDKSSAAAELFAAVAEPTGKAAPGQ